MILSHKYRFIFLKTGKVGGTSLEIALSKHLGPEDIITPIKASDEELRRQLGFPTAQNYEKPLREWTAADYWATAKAGLRGRRRTPRKFWNHMSAAEVRARVPADVWNSYYRFSVERNPWDQTVSRYFWENRQIDFSDYVKRGLNYKRCNYNIYSIYGIPAVDKIVRYEDFDMGLADVQKATGYPEDIYQLLKAIRTKATSRKVNGSYQKMFDAETRDIVSLQFAREIKLFGYEF